MAGLYRQQWQSTGPQRARQAELAA